MALMTSFECVACGRGPMTTGDTVYRMRNAGTYRCLACADETIEQEVLESAASVEAMGTEKH